MKKFDVRSSPKINLFLHVVGRRENSLHLIESIMLRVSNLYDIISFDYLDEDLLVCDSEFKDDLCLKIARTIKSKYNIKQGAKIKVKKSVPIGSGMGGGSANGASTINALLSLWDINASAEEKEELAIMAGCDIPFFMSESDIAFVSGVGEIIEPKILRSTMYILIANPGISLSTAQIFQLYKARNRTFNKPISLFLDPEVKMEQLIECSNDLQDISILEVPQIKTLLRSISGAEGCLLSRMSGSGATCFGLFSNESALQNAYQELRQQNIPFLHTFVLPAKK